MFKLLNLIKLLRAGRTVSLGIFGLGMGYSLEFLYNGAILYFKQSVLPFTLIAVVCLIIFGLGLTIYKLFAFWEKQKLREQDSEKITKTTYVVSNLLYIILNILPTIYSLYISFIKKPDYFGIMHKFTNNLELRKNFNLEEKQRWLMELKNSLNPRNDLWELLTQDLNLQRITNKAELYMQIHQNMLQQQMIAVEQINNTFTHNAYNFVMEHPYIVLGIIGVITAAVYVYKQPIVDLLVALKKSTLEIVEQNRKMVEMQLLLSQQQETMAKSLAEAQQITVNFVTKEQLLLEIAKLNLVSTNMEDTISSVLSQGNLPKTVLSQVNQNAEMIVKLKEIIDKIIKGMENSGIPPGI